MRNDLTKARRNRLRNPVHLEAYLQDHLRMGPDEFRIALREAVLSQPGGVAEVSRRIGLARTGLYKALSTTGNPSYRTVYQVLEALGMRTVITQQEVRRARSRRKMEKTKTYIEIGGEQHDKSAQKPVGQETQNSQKVRRSRILPGSGKGIFVMADDFDAPLPEFGEYM
jgi:probable addiction module antidote protein